jgi:hypothetical protein
MTVEASVIKRVRTVISEATVILHNITVRATYQTSQTHTSNTIGKNDNIRKLLKNAKRN